MEEVKRDLDRAVITVINLYFLAILMVRESQWFLAKFTVHEKIR